MPHRYFLLVSPEVQLFLARLPLPVEQALRKRLDHLAEAASMARSRFILDGERTLTISAHGVRLECVLDHEVRTVQARAATLEEADSARHRPSAMA